MASYLIRVPDHLGDGVMAIPAVAAISRLGPTVVSGPVWAARLYDLENKPHHRADIGVLMKPSFSAAWSHRHLPKRVGHPGDWRRWLLTDAVDRADTHRGRTYDQLAEAVGAQVTEYPEFAATNAERQRAPCVASDTVLLLPMSRSQDTVGWPHYRRLADELDGRALFAAGPGECDRLARIAGPHPCLPPLPVGEFAAVAAQVSAVVGNDSGLAHLAQAARRAQGHQASTLHVIFGSTEPAKTGPPGCTAHATTKQACAPCYKKVCLLGHDEPPCLDVPVDAILGAL